MRLDPDQEKAVQRTGQDICVVAGPGSGKTRVLVERFRWLVESQGFSPSRILTITFTDKAATEIKQRLCKAFEENLPLRSQIERAPISTIHAFCARILREHAITAGINPEFSVMEEPMSCLERIRAARAALDELAVENPDRFRALLDAIYVASQSGNYQFDLADSLVAVYESVRVAAGVSLRTARERDTVAPGTGAFTSLLGEVRRLLARTGPRTPAQAECIDALRAWARQASTLEGRPISAAHFALLNAFPRNYGRLNLAESLRLLRDRSVPEVLSALAGELFAPLRGLLWEALERMDRIYREKKQALGVLDFSDLEERALFLLHENPQVRSEVSENFDHILMDELQDTNPLQWKLLSYVRKPSRFFAVGDVNQSIYSFRHAEPEVFRQYRSTIQAQGNEIDELSRNYRSLPDILSAVLLVCSGARGIEAHNLKAVREPQEFPSVELIVCSGDTSEEAARKETMWIANRIQELVGSLVMNDGGSSRFVRYSDIAVLTRKRATLAPIKEALDEAAIPCLTAGGGSLYESREVKDLVHLLRVIDNPADEVALAGVLRSPLVGSKDESLLRLKRMGTLAAALARLEKKQNATSFEEGELQRLQSFWSLLRKARTCRDAVSPDRLLLWFIDQAGYEGNLDTRGLANVEKFLDLLRNWRLRTTFSLSRILQDLDWLREFQAEDEAPPDDSLDAVRLMTIHQSKGLEFPVVFLPSLQSGVRKRRPPVCYSPESGLGVCWRNPATDKAAGDPNYQRFDLIFGEKEAAEEDRLLYVAMTRAQERLVLSMANNKSNAPMWAGKVLSAFGLALGEVDKEPIVYSVPDSRLRIRLFRTDKEPGIPHQSTMQSAPRPTLHYVTPPRAGNQYDASIAVNSLVVFASCPRRYYLGDYLGWKGQRRKTRSYGADFEQEPENDELWGQTDAASLGREVHALLAGTPVISPKPEAVELASRFRQSELGRRVAQASRVEREFDFMLSVQDLILHGRIDLWFEHKEHLVLVDYKTDNVSLAEVNNLAELYAPQLRLYALALERLTGKLPDQAFLSLLRLSLDVHISVDEAAVGAAEALARELSDAQQRLQFPVRPGDHCFRCPFFQKLCPMRPTHLYPNGGDCR